MVETSAGSPVLSSVARGDGGRRRRFLRFTEDHMRALEKIASADFSELDRETH